MEFFDKKEEVLQIELTQLGKRKLSLGQLKPSYYAFVDDGVIYDSDYAGSSEMPKDAQERILKDTPVMKPATNKLGVESDMNRERVSLEEGVAFFSQDETEKVSSTRNLLGTFDGSQNAPSWKVSPHLNAKIVSYEQVLDESNIRIPQIELEPIPYNVNVITEVPREIRDFVSSFGIPGLGSQTIEFEDGTVLEVEEKPFLIEIDEKNTMFDNDNFELEVFVFEGDTLEPLYFATPSEEESNILCDRDENEAYEITDRHVEYYFDIQFDEEIPTKYLCQVSHKLERGVFDPLYIECSPREAVSLADIYATDTEDEGTGDDC